MSIALIAPKKLSGSIDVPPSKSDTHRAIICALLAKDISEIYPIDLSNDIMSTINAAETLGAYVKVVKNHLIIDSRFAFSKNYVTLNCHESGSTLRFLAPVVSAHGIAAQFEGTGTLLSRPMGVYADVLPKFGVRCTYNGALPFSVDGKLKPGKFLIPGNVSSLFITGLLFALPILHDNSEIILTTPRESSGYVDMTIKTMLKFGVKVAKTENGFKIPGNQHYKARNYVTEGDWSQAAFFLAAGAIGEPVTVHGIKIDSSQGDKAITKLLYRMGADVKCEENSVTVSPGNLSGFNVFAAPTPDLVPILAILGACAQGTTRILGASRLKFKESDRLRAINDGLKKLGVNVIETDDGLLIEGQKSFNKASLNGFNDHRIVMALSVAAIKAREKICISSAESISKSYPSFFEDYNKLGGAVNVLDI